MPEYHITWEIDLYADSPDDAARKALTIQRDAESIAIVFDVIDETGAAERIDLADIDDSFHEPDDQTISLSKSDWAEIYYAVELKRMQVTADNLENGRHANGVDLAAWRRQMEHIASALGPDGLHMHEALTALIESADRVITRWGETDLQFAVQSLDRALAPFGFGTDRRKKQ